MSTQVQWKRGTTAQNNTYTGAVGEIVVDTQLKQLRLHDGVTQGGVIIGSTSITVSTATNLSGGTAGQIPYQTAAGATSFFGAGTAGSVLVSYGSTGTPTFQNTLTLAGTTAATSSQTGALVVAGGVGIGGSLYVGGDLYVDGTQTILNSTNIQTGDKVVYMSTSSATALAAINSGIAIGPTTGVYASLLFDGVANWKSVGGLLPNADATYNLGSTSLRWASLAVSGNVTATTFVGNLTGNITGAGTGNIVYQSANNTTSFLSTGTTGQLLVAAGGAPVWTNTSSIYVYRSTLADLATTATNAGTAYATIATLSTGTGFYGGSFNGSTNQTWSLNTATLMTTAVNVVGGAAGSLPYQTAAGATTMLSLGSTGYVLTAGASAPQWTAISGLSAGLATTATNIAGGAAGSLPYQTAAGATTMLALGTLNSVLTAGSSSPTYVSQVLAGNGTASYTQATGQSLVVTGGGLGVTGNSYFLNNLGIGGSLYITGDLYVDGTQTVVNSNVISSGDKALVLSTGSTTAALASSAGLYIGATSATSYASLTFDGSTNWVVGGSSATNLKSAGLIVSGLTGYMYANGSGVVTAATTIPNAGLANSSITVTAGTGLTGGGSVSLGGSTTLTLNTATLMATSVLAFTANTATNAATAYSTIATLSTGTGFYGGSFNGSTAQTWSLNTATLMTTSVNLAGGLAGQFAYQTAAGATAFVSTGSMYVYRATMSDSASGSAGSVANALTIGTGLIGTSSTFNGSAAVTVSLNTATLIATSVLAQTATTATSAATAYSTIASLTAGTGLSGTAFNGSTAQTWTLNTATLMANAVTAINLAGGVAGAVPYQSAAGTTLFSAAGSAGQILVSGGTSAPVYSSNITLNNFTASTIVVTSTANSTSSYSANALYVAGGIGGNSGFNINGNGYLNGNLTVNGTITGTNAVLTVNQVTATSGVFYGDSTGNGALYAGVSNYTPFGQTMIQATGNLNNYMEVNVQNVNAGAKASTDIVASADNVTLSSAYIDMGIASSTFDGSQLYSLGQTVGPNDGYLMVGQNATAGLGDLVFGTLTSGTQMRFVVGPGISTTITNAYIAMTVNPATTQVNSTNTGVLTVNGGLGVAGGGYFSGIVTATTFVGAFSGTVTGTASTATNAATAYSTIGTLSTGTGFYGGSFNGSTNQTWSLNTATLMATSVLAFTATNAATAYSTIASLTAGTGLSGTAFNGSAAQTWTLNTATLMTTAVNITGGANGSLLYQSGANATTALAIGTNGYVLTSNGTTPQWAAASGVTAGNATNAANVATVAQNSNATYYPVFVNANNASSANMALYTSSTFSINPATGQYNIGGSLYVTGDLYVDGTQTVVNSNVISSGDKALVLSTGSSNASLASNAGLYIGATSATSYASLTFDGSSNWVVGGANATGIKSGALTVTGLTGYMYANGSGAVTAATTIPNAGLANSSITVTAGTGLSGGGAVSLGSSVTLSNAGVTSAVAGYGIAVSGATGAVTISASTASLYVYRATMADSASGSAGSVANSLTAGAGLTGSSFNGSAAVTWTLNTATLMQTSVNLGSGAGGSIPYQSAANTTAFLGIGTSGYVLTSNGSVPTWTAASSVTAGATSGTLTAGTGLSGTAFNGSANVTWTNAGVTSNVAGTGISVSGATGAVTITNTGVTSLAAGTGISVSGSTGGVTVTNSGVTSAVAGTGVSVSGATGAVTFSIGQAVATSSAVTFGSINVGSASGATTGQINASGEITAYSSDRRLKTNVRTIDNAVDKVLKLNGIIYNWNELANQLVGYDTSIDVVGLFAQDVEEVLPQAVKPAPFDIEDGQSKSGENYLTVQYEKVVPLLVEAIKEQQATIEALMTEIRNIKDQLGNK